MYPTTVKMAKETVSLFEAPPVRAPFIVLENQVRDSDQRPSRAFHVLPLVNNLLKFGRGHASNVRIDDVPISRCHATIRFHEGQFLIADCNSKFGTSVALRRFQPILPNQPLSIQVGRTVLSFQLQAAQDRSQNGAAALSSNAEMVAALGTVSSTLSQQMLSNMFLPRGGFNNDVEQRLSAHSFASAETYLGREVAASAELAASARNAACLDEDDFTTVSPALSQTAPHPSSVPYPSLTLWGEQ
jgi:pSer/pThr/pTyr-binding forkhead associated (FHA) protein